MHTHTVAPLAADTVERINLKRLFVLRNIAIIGQLVAVYASIYVLELALPVVLLGMVITAHAMFNLFTRFRLHWGGRISQIEFLLQLLADVVVLTTLLYLTGGATNPFVLLFLMPLIIATAVLPARYVWVLAGVTALCYSLLMWRYLPLPHGGGHGTGHGSSFDQHVFGMWLAFVISAVVVSYFVVSMRRTLHNHELALARAREQRLRDEQLVMLGTLAASTAHEMGTPLGTMALLCDELEATISEDPAQAQAQLDLLREQVTRCKTALGNLSASAGGIRLHGGRLQAVDTYLQQLFANWQVSHTTTSVKQHWQGLQPAPQILADQILNQALMNILDNAAEASASEIEWDASWNATELHMEIRDRGPGLTEEAKQLVGRHPYSAKEEGMGLGLFLAHAVIPRFHGTVKLFNRQGGGVKTVITLPLNPLTTAAP
ncbi:MAG: ATP-binding protein [Granulosicoccaceae bacterium]|jgi:two-component system sensor histidine kinase RegB